MRRHTHLAAGERDHIAEKRASGPGVGEVERAYDLINDRPRKVLGYRTASEVYREMLHSA